ncbi:PH domain-containing protein [Aestuariibacter salexigens]|uniref:PH domain-containing protein n=1 Tax=Aestuariibacter salexigens TaxID=226010 RepID=UPI000479E563|nr:PH domain-containing protein [Aestuariibacter salexigens]
MSNEAILRADIDSKVLNYWLALAVIICMFGVITLVLLPLIIPLVMIGTRKYLAALSVELFERKLSVKKGVFVRVEKSVPLEKITDISMVQGPLMRYFGLYRLNFETAGQSGEGALVNVIGIINAEAFRERVLAQKDKISEKAAPKSEQVDTQDPLLTSVKNIEAMLEQLLARK